MLIFSLRIGSTEITEIRQPILTRNSETLQMFSPPPLCRILRESYGETRAWDASSHSRLGGDTHYEAHVVRTAHSRSGVGGGLSGSGAPFVRGDLLRGPDAVHRGK